MGVAAPASRCDERLGCNGSVAQCQCARDADRPNDGADRGRSIRRQAYLSDRGVAYRVGYRAHPYMSAIHLRQSRVLTDPI
jgi:hypothetical protein